MNLASKAQRLIQPVVEPTLGRISARGSILPLFQTANQIPYIYCIDTHRSGPNVGAKTDILSNSDPVLSDVEGKATIHNSLWSLVMENENEKFAVDFFFSFSKTKLKNQIFRIHCSNVKNDNKPACSFFIFRSEFLNDLWFLNPCFPLFF